MSSLRSPIPYAGICSTPSRSRPMRVVDLTARQSISRPAISRHLRLLTEAGLLEVEQHGRERHYALRTEPLREVREYLDRVEAPAPAG